MNLVWFRMDLRLADNPALFHAMSAAGKTCALFILNPKQHQLHGESPQKYEFIKAHVNDVTKRLAKLGINSMVHEVPRYADVPGLFEQILKTHDIDGLYLNRNYWVNEVKRDHAIKQLLAKHEICVYEFACNYLLPPGSVRKQDGSMYHVFTPYKNKFIETLKQQHQQPLPIPDQHKAYVSSHETILDCFKLSQWPIGETVVTERVDSFNQSNDYQSVRDFPALLGTSRLSPYLTLGVISARQCLAYALKHQGEAAFYSTWTAELIWRDYYHDLMFEYPRLCKHQTFKPDAMDEWKTVPEIYQAWQQGQTGFPLVDAGMRQLLQEGWMHNRVRMVVASFLSKLCLVDWRLGEAHFMAHLIDGDLASNNGGWQWSAATGCDAAPYFRIFNPTTQSIKFDPNGRYIRQYVSELSLVPVKEIHNPDSSTRAEVNYPEPIIDYHQARQQALNWFKEHSPGR